jgi:hypothetical protein
VTDPGAFARIVVVATTALADGAPTPVAAEAGDAS